MNESNAKIKVVQLGTVLIGKYDAKVFCKIVWDGKDLSISGVEGPLSSGDCRGSCGQIIMGFKEFDARGHSILADITPNCNWTYEMIRKFFNIWARWHLNDLKAGCEHQRELGWDKEPIDPLRPTTDYDKFDGKSYTWNLKCWVYPPLGYLMMPCPQCGYKFGIAWLREEVPQDVIDFLFSLPDTQRQPAWI